MHNINNRDLLFSFLKNTLKNNYSIVIGWIISFIPIGNIYAQTGKINCKVIDKLTKEPLVGATVFVLGTTDRSITDDYGNTSVLLEGTSEIYIVSALFIGYLEEKIKVASNYSGVIVFELSEEENKLEEIIVSATTSQKMKKYPESVTIIEGAQIQGKASSLEDILSKTMGVSIRQSGGLGSASRIAIHGLEGKRIQIYVDNTPLNRGDGSFNLNDIPLNMIDHIEIYKGIIPARFGGDGLGGAINIVTNEFNTDCVDLAYSYGSYNTHKGNWLFKKNYAESGILLASGGLVHHSDNDYIMDSPYQEGLKIKRDHDQYSVGVVGASIAFSKFWFDKIKIEINYSKNKKQIQGIQQNIQSAKVENYFLPIIIDLEKDGFFSSRLDLKYHLQYVPLVHTQLTDTASYRFDFNGHKYPNPNGQGELNGIPHLSDDKRMGVRQELDLDYRLKEGQNINLHSSFLYGYKKPYDLKADEYAGFKVSGYENELYSLINGLTLESKFLENKIRNNLGVKHFFVHTSVANIGKRLIGMPLSITQNSMHRFGVNEAASFKLFRSFNLKTSYQYALRLPDADELFGDGVVITAAPNLKPENSNNFNVGLLFNRYNTIGLYRLQLEANGFYMKVKDMIKLEAGIPTSGYVNLGAIDIKGFDAEVKVDITENDYIYYNITVQDIRDVMKNIGGSSVPNPTKGKQVPNIPRVFHNWGFEYHKADILGKEQYTKIFWDSQYIAQYYYNWQVSSRQNYVIPKSFTHNLGIQHSLKNGRYQITFEIHNITNQALSNLYRMPLMGRYFEVKFRYTWIRNL